MASLVYPREVICGGCGVAMVLSWSNPLELSQGGDPVYEHPQYGSCELAGKRLTPTGLFVEVLEYEWEKENG